MNRTIKHSFDGNPLFSLIGLGVFSLVTWLGLRSLNLDKKLTSAPLLEISVDKSTIIDPGFIFEAYMQEDVRRERSPNLYSWYIYMFNHYNPDPSVSNPLILPDLDRDGYVFGREGRELHYAQP